MDSVLVPALWKWVSFSQFLQDLLSVFVILNPIGGLPIFLGLTQEATLPERRRVFRLASTIGFGIVAVMAIGGNFILHSFFHIDTQDLQFGGGLLLVAYGGLAILRGQANRRTDKLEGDHLIEANTRLAVSPIASPLLVGPGAIVVVMLLAQQSGALYALLACVIVFTLVALILHWAHWGYRIMGPVVTMAVGGVMNIFLVAIGVHFIFTSIKHVFMK